MSVTKRFSNGKTHKNVKTVGETIEELKRLHPDTLVKGALAKSVDLIYYNAKQLDEHVAFENGGSWDKDAEY